jgi:glycosyltransferase involved in cell wall biosynthesis
MHVLVLEPFDSGSHRAFLDGWLSHSRHRFTRLSLPGKFWKWRMRHAAVTFAQQAGQLDPADPPDVVFASSMLNLAEFRGLAPRAIAQAPTVLYFHENQLAYPDPRARERDRHFTLTNLTSALAGDAVWFNSAFNRDSFIDRLPKFLKQMPTRHMCDAPETVRAKAAVHPPGIDPLTPPEQQSPGPLRIAWVGRWEHDKNPEDFFAAMEQLTQSAVDFRVSVLGEQAIRWPAVFDQARPKLAGHLDHWGYQSPADYAAALQAADVVVSTAWHEFFGLAIMEACSAGCLPVLPDRVVYPELFPRGAWLYDGSVTELVTMLRTLSQRKTSNQFPQADAAEARAIAKHCAWPEAASRLDAALSQLVPAVD